MDIHQGIILGALQGLTEFLPVSSSGHLVLGQLFFGITESVLSFDISVHMGTLMAVLVGFMLILTGLILWGSRRFYANEPGQVKFTLGRALWIGLVQGCAVIPGISRSGSTISAGLAVGLDRDTAARFSFLMSIPAIVGAQILSLRHTISQGLNIDPATICGTIVAFVTGLVALKLLLKLVHSGKFHYFAPYCWGLGLLVLVLNFA